MATKFKSCLVESCKAEAGGSKGYCVAHYTRLKRHGSPTAGGPARAHISGSCSVQGCSREIYAKGSCTMHYARLLRRGTTATIKASPGVTKAYMENVVIPYKGDDCLRWPFATNKGWAKISKSEHHSGNLCRYVCSVVHGPPPTPEHHAAHSCGNGDEGCCTPNHLSWKTATENAADKLIHGTSPRGENCGTAKLTAEQVIEIRSLLGKEFQREIAKRYGVSQGLISRIAVGKAWGWQVTG